MRGTVLLCAIHLLIKILYVYSLPPGEMSGVLEVGGLAAKPMLRHGGQTGN